MSETSNMIPLASEEYEPFLPVGWAEGDDIFDVDSWSGGAAKTDEPLDDNGQEEVNEEFETEMDDASAIGVDVEGAESENDGDETPAIEPNTARSKIKFSTQIDHKMQDVELDEDELPAIYQKAHVVDRMKNRLAQAQPIIDRSTKLAKMLGYDTAEAMFEAAEASYRQGEIDRLTGEGVHPDVASELVDSRVQRTLAEMPASVDEDETPATRDFRSEVADLLKAHPELRGTKLPDAVVQACVVNGRPLVSAYDEYSRKQSEAENRALKAQNKRLKQNADAATRAPVRGVSKGGAAAIEPDDPFIRGFNSDRW